MEKSFSEEFTIYKKAIELGNYGIAKLHVDDNNVFLSDVGKKILGLADEDSCSLNTIKDALLTEEKNALNYVLEHLANYPDKHTLQIKIHKPTESGSEIRNIHVNLELAERKNKIPKTILAVFEDITDQKRAEKELHRTREKAMQSEKNKTAFLVNMSHEIRNPMNAIIGFSELLNIGNPSSENRKKWAKLIKDKGKQLLTFIDDVIELAKLETGKFNISKSECDLNKLIWEAKHVYDLVKIEKEKPFLDLRVSVPTVTIKTYNDYGRISQILNNLLNNSIKFTNKGFIEFGYDINTENEITFFVKDSGIGMSPEEQHLIFNRFRQNEIIISKKYTGSGLGLTISKSIIEQLNGRIWVESSPGHGSTFYFTIPYEIIPEKRDSIDLEELELTNFYWKNKVILVVEDDDVNYMFLETVLHDTQAQILRAKDGFQALDLVKSINQIDLILMDIKMPKMNGYQTTREIRNVNKTVCIIAQTAFTLKEDVQKCMEAGCNDFISKPIDIKTLVTKIDQTFND